MKKTRILSIAVSLAVSGVLIAGCSGTAAPQTSAEEGDLDALSIGFFSPGTSNTYAATLTQSAVDTADELGVKLDNQSANFDVQTQINQLQQALQRKTYNAWLVVPLDPNQECSILEKAVAAGIKVALANSASCSTAGPEGGVSVVAVQNPDTYVKWWDYIFTNDEPGDIAVLMGTPLDYLTTIANDTLETELSANPGWNVVSNQPLNYSTDAAYQNVQALLKSQPNLKAIASIYSGMTQGAIQAVEQAGKTGQVKIYDFNGDKNMVAALQAGTVEMTVPGLPASEGGMGVIALVDAWQGKEVAEVQNPMDSVDFPGKPFLTGDNAAEYTSQY